MSIAAANLFTRNVWREFVNPGMSGKAESDTAKIVSLVVKFGALGFILFLNPSFAIDLQLIGGVIILQVLPAVGLGLVTRWFHRGGLILGWAAGMVSALWMLYQIPKIDPSTGDVVKAHFGGSGYALSNWGFDTDWAIWTGIPALLLNLAVAVVVTMLLRAMKIPGGTDSTRHGDYYAEAGEAGVKAFEPEVGMEQAR
jgi:SSS family solute:Na+ symporter